MSGPASERAASIAPRSDGRTVAWVDPLKGIALLWIVVNHLSERLLGSAYFANPRQSWPPASVQLEQLRPLTGHGWLDRPLDLLRYVGWSGDEGVQLFLILSGFGLAYGYARAPARLPLRAFFARRLLRLYPTWWGAHAFYLPFAVLLAWPTGGVKGLLLSLAGLRILPGNLYSPVPAWWFVTLLLQLYLLFPLLRLLLLRLGPDRFLLLVLLVALPIRAAGLLWFDGYLDAWSRGAIAITRVPEFAFGMALAQAWSLAPEDTASRLRRPAVLLLALLLYVAGVAMSFSLLGMAPALLLLGVGSFVLLLALVEGPLRRVGWVMAPLRWAGAHSYSLFLVHHPLILHLVPLDNRRGAVFGTLMALLLMAPVALLLEHTVAYAGRLWQTARERGRILRLVGVAAATVTAAVALLLGAERLVRQFDPREVGALGWGERPSLQP
ncbi:MAG TPA: acyltransferase family protein, partial [Planctomycetota bacterium]|nr:acyltransferase family protein [Planctomycetota bacterium]